MNRLASRFMIAAVIYGVIGFAGGVYMGATHEFAMRSVHSHINLFGWVSFAIFAVYYQLVAKASESKMAAAHFWLSNIGLIVMTVGLVMLSTNNAAGGPLAGIGSVVSLISFIIFAIVVFSYSCAHCEKK
ncbi:MAG: cbb3-type cytochrome c oxidase subunit I [Deltaproteobacteria bacterium]|nr:cbb3-type cytochrome c oxidase subunit I [Deltaproteobacteria bacterium]